ncbi:hypothetical protein BpHYR1_019071 [Brachionus plicatilis]|uniref:Uncharacterized protein n=1 Tax=Brachionus plicatilis TaxID=10195 RepID=A0A3M7SFS5_BRAPC|nr:hypothetical protein BpHYR1_019071 [Brachionus plicatilis]
MPASKHFLNRQYLQLLLVNSRQFWFPFDLHLRGLSEWTRADRRKNPLHASQDITPKWIPDGCWLQTAHFRL